MAQVFTISAEYRQLKEKWYNNRERAIAELADLDPANFADAQLFIAQVVKLQAEIKLWKEVSETLDTYFS